MLVRGSLDVTFLLLVTLWVVIEGTLADEVPRGSRNLAVLASLTGFAIVALFVVALQSRGGSTFGALVMLAGIALRCIAIYTLGDRFVSELRADAPLIRRGVYRFLDHPSEAGLLTLTLGACVLFGSIAAFAIWLFAVLPLTIARVRIENTFLRDKQECLSYTHITSSTMPTTTERTGPSFESST
ncbi:MAG TPA: isoprenylcysteine carboxylmethyltransferase family protein [Thermoanaerobaculia bacterium]|nr:isoprenylcysteine carboxylmethyltransferase family protein [Thermoanaerobaculia bacterium]